MKSNVASVRLLCDSRLPLALRVQLLRVRVFSVLLYNAESWDLSDDSLYRTLKHFCRRCMATLLKKEVQSISAEECSMDDPVQATCQLQWNWEGHVERMPLDRLPKLCRDVVGYSGLFDRCLLSRANDRREWINCTTMANKWTETSMIELHELNLCTVHVSGIPDRGLCQL